MITRTIFAASAFALFSLSITAGASAQSYRQPIRHIANYSNVVTDSVESARLQVSILQPDKASLKFRIAILNQLGHAMNISIVKNDDVLFSETAYGDQYFNLFNLNQLEDGDYKVIVFNGKDRITKSIHLQTATTVDRVISIN